MLIKIIGIGLSGAVLSLIIKQYRPDIAIAVPILTAAAITLLCVPYISSMIDMFERIADQSGISSQHLQNRYQNYRHSVYMSIRRGHVSRCRREFGRRKG